MFNILMAILHSVSKRRIFLLCVAIFMFYTILPLPCNICLAQQKGPAAPVTVSNIIQIDVRQPVKMVGTVFPFRESIVAGTIEGLVEKFPVKRGDYVKKGDVLAKLRLTTLNVLLKGAEAVLKVQEAAIGEAEAAQHLALLGYQRAMELIETRTISDQEYDEFKTRYEKSVESSKKELSGLEAQETEVERILVNIDECTIKAPFDGRVIEEHVEVGQWLDRGDSVVSMIELDSVKVRVPVPEKYIHNLKVGDECGVVFPALGGITKTGSIIHIVPQADERGRTFPVYVKLENDDEMIKSGMFAEATFELGALLSATMVLKDGVVRRGGKTSIFLAVDGEAIEVPVQTGISHKNLIRIMGEVQSGTDVIVRGNERLRNKQKIKITGRIDIDAESK